MSKVVPATIRKRRIRGCVVSPPSLDVEVGDTIKFTAEDTKATVLIPYERLTSKRVLDIDPGQSRTMVVIGGKKDQVYEYTVYGFGCRDVRGRGRFARGNSPPKIIIKR